MLMRPEKKPLLNSSIAYMTRHNILSADLCSNPFQPSNLPLLCTFWGVPTWWPPYFSGGGFGGKLLSSWAWNQPNLFQHPILGLARAQCMPKITKVAKNAEIHSMAAAAYLVVSTSQSICDTKDAVAPVLFAFTRMTLFCTLSMVYKGHL